MNNIQGLLGIIGGLAGLFLFAWGLVYIIYRSERSTKKVTHKSSVTQPPESPANTRSHSPQADHIRAKTAAMNQKNRIPNIPGASQRPSQKPRRPPEPRP